MDKINLIKAIRTSRTQRNFFIALSGAILISNMALSTYINFQERTVVVVPTHISKEFEVSTKHVSPSYLEMRARDVVQSFLNLTPQNMEYFAESILNMAHPKFHGDLSQQIAELSEDVKGRDVRTYFTINETGVSVDELTVEVTGYLETFVGQRQTSSELKKYLVGFDYTGSRLLLTTFQEITEEKE